MENKANFWPKSKYNKWLMNTMKYSIRMRLLPLLKAFSTKPIGKPQLLCVDAGLRLTLCITGNWSSCRLSSGNKTNPLVPTSLPFLDRPRVSLFLYTSWTNKTSAGKLPCSTFSSLQGSFIFCFLFIWSLSLPLLLDSLWRKYTKCYILAPLSRLEPPIEH